MNTQLAGRSDTPDHVLSHYPLLKTPWQRIPIAQTGFSGARLWRVETGQAAYCLRRWPVEHPTRERLEFIHSVLKHVAASGLAVVPVPLPDRTGQTIVDADHALWELTRWLPGKADFPLQPSHARLAAAMSLLAQFHQSTATFRPVHVAPSPSLAERSRQFDELRDGGLVRLANAIRDPNWASLVDYARQFVELAPTVVNRVAPKLTSACRLVVLLQPCIRDIWHDHVLFSGEQVTGIVDFGAMRVDNIACDVARLMGSLVADDPVRRAAALGTYDSRRPLSSSERVLVEAFDQSTVVLGGLNWLRWIYLEGRQFPDRQRVEQRLAALLTRLRFLAAPW